MATKKSKSGKKVVRVETGADEKAAKAGSASGPTWKPTPEANSKATKLRLVAAVLWVVAIGLELFAIFGVLNTDEGESVNMALLIGLIVVIGLLAIGGSLLWKRANVLDPASKSDPIKFFVQNQLGAIITVIAFLPLLILILVNPDLTKKDKAIAGGIGAVVLVIATLFGTSLDSPSTEEYTEKTNEVVSITGKDEVYWTKDGDVYHLCENASAVNLESEDAQIYSGSVAEAHAAGKDRLTKQIDQEIKQCGFEERATANAGSTPAVPDDSTS